MDSRSPSLTEDKDLPLVMSLDQATILQSRPVTVIDTRFPEEIEVFGAISGAHNLPLSCLQRFTGEHVDPPCEEFSVRDLTVAERRDLTSALVKYAAQHTTLLCVCRSGNRSEVAARIIRELGHPHAVSLQGGLREWEDWIQRTVLAQKAQKSPHTKAAQGLPTSPDCPL